MLLLMYIVYSIYSVCFMYVLMCVMCILIILGNVQEQKLPAHKPNNPKKTASPQQPQHEKLPNPKQKFLIRLAHSLTNPPIPTIPNRNPNQTNLPTLLKKPHNAIIPTILRHIIPKKITVSPNTTSQT